MKALQVGKRYVNTIDSLPLYYNSSIVDEYMNDIGFLEEGDVCVLLEIVQITNSKSSIDLKVLAPNGTIGWIWSNWNNAALYLQLLDSDQ